MQSHLSTIIVTKAERALTVKTVSPEATEIDIGLAELSVSDDQPSTEDGLSKHIKDGVGDDLAVDTNLTGTISEAPDDGVRGPEDESVDCNGDEELGNSLALALDGSTAVYTKVPNDNEVGEAGNGVPSPLGRGTLRAESSEEAGKDHDEVSDDGHGEVGTVHASQKTKVEEQKRSGDSPVHVTCPEDLAVDLVVGVRDVVVLLTDVDVVDRDTLAGGHGEVGDGRSDSDQSGDDIEEALLHRDPPCEAREDTGGDQHDDEDNP